MHKVEWRQGDGYEMGQRMISNQLEAFIRTAELGSFHKAGESLYLSSIAIKKQIDKLESQLGVQLFVRTNRGVTLTAAGEKFLEGALSIVELTNAVIAATREAAANNPRIIRVGMSFLRPGQPLVDVCYRLGMPESSFTFSFVPFGDSSQDMDTALKQLGKDIDCLLAPCDSVMWQSLYNILVIEELSYRIAVPVSHRLAGREILTWEDLDGERLMVPFSTDFPTATRLRNHVLTHHPEIELLESPEHYDIAVFNRCVEEGFLLLAYDLWENIHPSLTVKPVDWDYCAPYGLVYPKKPTPVMVQFTTALEEKLSAR